jgi:hypothetical protein
LGIDHNEFKVPKQVYKRRLATNKLFTDAISGSGKDGDSTFKEKNPFTLLSDETIERIEAFITEHKATHKHSVLNGFYFENLAEEEEIDEDSLEADEIDGPIIYTKPSCPRKTGDNVDENLARYTELQEQIKKREGQLEHATAKFDLAYKGPSLVLSRNVSRTRSEPISANALSYTAKILIRHESGHLEKGQLLQRLKAWRGEAIRGLEQLHRLQQRAIRGVQAFGLVTEGPLPQLFDLIGVIARCQELEKKVVAQCVRDDGPRSVLGEDIMLVENDLNHYMKNKVYQVNTSKKDKFDANSAESFFNDRIDKIKKTIYRNYYNARQINRKVWQLRKKTA